MQITTVSKKSPPAALIATDGLFHCHHVTITKGTMTKHPRHLQHSTGQQETVFFPIYGKIWTVWSMSFITSKTGIPEAVRMASESVLLV